MTVLSALPDFGVADVDLSISILPTCGQPTGQSALECCSSRIVGAIAIDMIPFNRPPILGGEIENIQAAIASRKLSGDGGFTKRCNEWLERRLGAHRALLTHSCTAALEMAAILCGLKPGDEVIMPSFTFVSTANAVVLRGAVPVFVDIDPRTLNIDPAAIATAITPRTRAIFVVHYAGVPCDMDAINAIAATHRLIVVEDAAQALGSTYKGRPAGALGHLAAISFHETKNLVSGEGGALVVNDATFVERAEIIREKGTNRSRFLRGEVDKYTWVDIGSSYLPSELVAAFLYAQLQELDTINADRLETWNAYHAALAPLEAAGRLELPWHKPVVGHNAHLYHVLLAPDVPRPGFIEAMKAAGIGPTFHYVPLHSSLAGRQYGRIGGELSVTDRVADCLVRLPLYYGMGAERDRVIEAVMAYFAR
jgi:dTDP-4-amino-4,6-dideoxygalactose transaminase